MVYYLFDKEIRDPYPYELIKACCELVINTRKISSSRYEAIRSMLLYHLQEMPDGYLPLNREYKPLGIPYYGKHVKYEDFPFLLIPKNEVRIGGTLKAEGYFFDDGCFPDNREDKLAYIRGILLTFPRLYESFDKINESNWKA
jgi:hypothetical protein